MNQEEIDLNLRRDRTFCWEICFGLIDGYVSNCVPLGFTRCISINRSCVAQWLVVLPFIFHVHYYLSIASIDPVNAAGDDAQSGVGWQMTTFRIDILLLLLYWLHFTSGYMRSDPNAIGFHPFHGFISPKMGLHI